VYRNTYNAVVDEIDLRESYFPGWEASVKEGRAQGVMCVRRPCTPSPPPTHKRAHPHPNLFPPPVS
jgi:hypothetical protein